MLALLVPGSNTEAGAGSWQVVVGMAAPSQPQLHSQNLGPVVPSVSWSMCLAKPCFHSSLLSVPMKLPLPAALGRPFPWSQSPAPHSLCSTDT